MALTIPNTISPGQLMDADKVQQNFVAVANKFTSGIVDSEVSATASINASKLAGSSITSDKIAPGQVKQAALEDSVSSITGVSTAKLVDQCVTQPKLGLASVGNLQLGLIAVDTPQIKDAAVTTAKLATVLSIGLNKLAIATESIAYSTIVGAATCVAVTFNNATHFLVSAYVVNSTSDHVSWHRTTATGTTFAVFATNAAFPGGVTGNAGSLVLVYINRT